MQDKRKTTKATIAVAATLLFLFYCIGCSVPVGSQVGQKATDFTLSAVDSNKINLGDLEGKPVLLTFWTTGCGACIYQMPFLEAAHDALGNEVEFINIDIMEDSYTVKQCTDYYGFSLPVALDSDGTVSEAYNVMYTPTNVVIDSNGIIQHIKIGAFTDTEQILTIFNDVK
jgi:cytochrome c biogenesis protein CcmG/thiol:disulfide interchange protein DsbE